jgi:hypothetical protein
MIPTVEQLREQAQIDLDFSIANLGNHAIRLASSREKWSRWAMDYQLKIYKIESDMKLMYGKLHRHFLSDSDLAIDRRDINFYIESDSEYRLLSDRLAVNKATLKYIDGVMENIKQATYDIGNSIKWEIWKSGGS